MMGVDDPQLGVSAGRVSVRARSDVLVSGFPAARSLASSHVRP
jgi:hypothetical protein